MAKGKMLSIVVTAFVLAACGGPEVTLKNTQSGEVASCKGGVTTTGVTSGRVAEDLMTKCVDGYTQHGYEVVSAKQ